MLISSTTTLLVPCSVGNVHLGLLTSMECRVRGPCLPSQLHNPQLLLPPFLHHYPPWSHWPQLGVYCFLDQEHST
ncbi:hypothetical protein EDB92DRAFT_1856250, partial [Lactarius akahatsu]